ncbi:dissimilatory sulfite reductase D family protein [Candidatus Electronema sp. JM]|uniref:dissimilatory sulfite reductase D family protein n=1 Tax=Candidatus Electronema sp. JM TaxID=3401571 RepID=UPI003AA8F5B7
MPLSVEEVEAAILEKAAKWHKPQLYLMNFYECDPDRSRRDIKKIADGLVKKKRLMFWCTGGSIMYVIPERLEGEK